MHIKQLGTHSDATKAYPAPPALPSKTDFSSPYKYKIQIHKKLAPKTPKSPQKLKKCTSSLGHAHVAHNSPLSMRAGQISLVLIRAL